MCSLPDCQFFGAFAKKEVPALVLTVDCECFATVIATSGAGKQLLQDCNKVLVLTQPSSQDWCEIMNLCVIYMSIRISRMIHV
jgi:hypothetical protein